jgi:hypothetical protein
MYIDVAAVENADMILDVSALKAVASPEEEEEEEEVDERRWVVVVDPTESLRTLG